MLRWAVVPNKNLTLSIYICCPTTNSLSFIHSRIFTSTTTVAPAYVPSSNPITITIPCFNFTTTLSIRFLISSQQPNMVKPSSNQTRRNRPGNCSLKSQLYKGIRMRKWGKWVSEIRVPNSMGRIWLGSYDAPEKAARAYDFAVYCLRGPEAKFNFPDSLPEISDASSLSPSQIQAAAAKFAAEELHLPSEDKATFSWSCSKGESSIESEEISVEQDPAFWDAVLEDLDSWDPITLEDFALIDGCLEDYGFLPAE